MIQHGSGIGGSFDLTHTIDDTQTVTGTSNSVTGAYLTTTAESNSSLSVETSTHGPFSMSFTESIGDASTSITGGNSVTGYYSQSSTHTIDTNDQIDGVDAD